MTTEDLIELQEEIEECKVKKFQLEGERNSILKQLKEEWSCKNVKQAEKLVKDKEQEIIDLEEDIEKGLEELEAKLEQ